MGDWVWNPNEDNADDDDEILEPKFSGRDGTIYLVDAQNFGLGEENFAVVLKCIEAGMLNGILMNDRDLIGVVFYNTMHSPDPNDTDTGNEIALAVPNNMAIFMPLKPYCKESIQYFKNFKASDDFFDFGRKYGTVATEHFSEALWLCSRMFMNCGYKLHSKLIVLFTNNEQPHAPGSAQLQQAFQRAEDMQKNDGNLIVVPTNDAFDMEPFFKEFCCIVTDTDLEAFRSISPEDQRQLLLNRVYQRHYRSMCLRYLNVTLGEGLELACGIYSFIRHTKIPTAVKILRDTNDVVVSKRSLMGSDYNEETNTVEYTRKLLPGEIFKCQDIGGKEVIFTSEELTNTRSLITPGIRVLGFKPIDKLPERCFIRRLAFLYPAEDRIKGSTKLFRALWEKCLEKQKYILCVLTYRRKGPSRYIALVPQKEETGGHDGFRMVFLPMTTDLNHLDVLESDSPEVDPAGVELFKRICKKLKFKYKPDLFANPHLQTFHSNMEALVFDESGVDLEDTTVPNTTCQDSKIHDYVEDLIQMFGRETLAAKRTATAANGGPSKIPKKDLTNEEVAEAVRNGRGEVATVPNLKDYLKSQDQSFPSKATKKDLIEIIKRLVE